MIIKKTVLLAGLLLTALYGLELQEIRTGDTPLSAGTQTLDTNESSTHPNFSELSPSRTPASAAREKKSWSFHFKNLARKSFQIKKEAANFEEAFRLASQDCFKLLTQGKYPGEEKGLDIIDICVNPKT